jgi:hypothetical protein
MTTYMASLGGFEHTATLAATGQLDPVLKVLFASQPFGLIGSIPGKIAIGITLLRILGPTASKRFRWFLYTIFALTTAFGVSDLLAYIFRCNPIDASWIPDIQATCYPTEIGFNYTIFVACMSECLIFFS